MLTLTINSHSCGNAMQRVYETSDHFWSYAGKMIIITRSLLNAAARNVHIVSRYGKDFPEKVRLITTRMKLFSIVGVGFSLGSLKPIAEKIFSNLLSQNKEGVALNVLSFSITVIDVVDSTSTFVNAALELSGRAAIESLSNLGIPLITAMSLLGITSRIIQIAKVRLINRTVSGLDKEINDAILAKKSISEEQISKIIKPLNNLIATEMPSEIKRKLNDLHGFIKNSHEEQWQKGVKELSQRVTVIHQALKKQLIIHGLGIFANALTLSALALFTFATISSAPFLLVASSFVVRVSSLAYQDLTEET